MNRNEKFSAPRYEALLQLLRTSEALWNASRLFFARWELSPSQFNILNLLHMDGGMTQIELSRHLITHRSNVTGLIDRLEKRGLVSRKPVPNDRRAYHVELTTAGSRLLHSILPEYQKRTEDALGGVPLRQLPLLDKQLRTIQETAGALATDFKKP